MINKLSRRPDNEETKLVSLNKLWDKNKDLGWESELTPEDIANAFIYDDDYVWTQADKEELTRYDVESVAFWIDRLQQYVGKEKDIPERWNIFVDETGEIIDGFHRMTAAYIVGLQSFPVVGYIDEGMVPQGSAKNRPLHGAPVYYYPQGRSLPKHLQDRGALKKARKWRRHHGLIDVEKLEKKQKKKKQWYQKEDKENYQNELEIFLEILRRNSPWSVETIEKLSRETVFEQSEKRKLDWSKIKKEWTTDQLHPKQTEHALFYRQKDKNNKPIAGVTFSTVDWEDNEIAHISLVAVSPAWRNLGLGKALVRDLARKYGYDNINWGMTTGEGEKLKQSMEREMTPYRKRGYDMWGMSIKEILVPLNENIIDHLRNRGVDFDRSQVITDLDSDMAVFLLYNFSGQLVGYQQYNPSASKKTDKKLKPTEQKYFTYISKHSGKTIAVWGLDSITRMSYFFLVEGIFDAIKLHNEDLPAIAVLGNDPKIIGSWLKAMNKFVIVIADNDKAGNKLKKLGKKVLTVPEPYKDLGEMPQDEVLPWIKQELGFLSEAKYTSIFSLRETHLPGATFFHGTNREFKPGDIILPPSITGKISEKGRKKNLDRVFFTLDKGSAKIYAGRTVQSLGGNPHVYIIEPEGDVSWINKTRGTTVLMSSSAKVIKKLF